MLFHGGLDERVNGTFIAGIADSIRPFADIGSDDRRTFIAEQFGRCLADAGRCAGNDRDLA
jgi:hypothetical protein